MIAQLKGTIVSKTSDSAIIDVAGVGYRVYTTPGVLLTLEEGQAAMVLTHLAVRETALDVYGFSDEASLEFFEMLISISGIGPKTALGILSLADVETLSNAIRSGDTSYLTKVSGIGKKSAERVVVELRDKLGALEPEKLGTMKDDVDILEALQSLGYRTTDAREALKLLPKELSGTNKRLKEVLKILSNGKR